MNSEKLNLFVGTYTEKESNGIQLLKFDTRTGESEYVEETPVKDPSYLVLDDQNGLLYSVTEGEGKDAVATAFKIGAGHKLHFLNQRETEGDAPCYVNIGYDNKYLFTANYSGGSITIFEVMDNGEISPVRQLLDFNTPGEEDSQLHCVVMTPDGRYMFATDLGRSKIYTLQFSGDSAKPFSVIETYSLPEKTGPRHLVFHPSGRFLYMISELSDEVFVFAVNGSKLEKLQQLKAYHLSPGGSADIHLSPDNKYLYTSHRKEGDGISIFSVDENSGKLINIGFQKTGKHPRNFIITPNGDFLLSANRDDNSIQVFRRDKETGILCDTGKDIVVNMPVCLKFAKG